MLTIIDNHEIPTRITGDDLRCGHVYKDNHGNLIMSTDEGSVICLRSGIIMSSDCDDEYHPVEAELSIK